MLNDESFLKKSQPRFPAWLQEMESISHYDQDRLVAHHQHRSLKVFGISL
jgi:hypothetical protein